MASVIEKLEKALSGIRNRGENIGVIWVRKSFHDQIKQYFMGMLLKATKEETLIESFQGIQILVNDNLHSDLDAVINGIDGKVIGLIHAEKEIKKIAKKSK